MRILITNDDGIHAPGLTALEHIASALSDDVWVVAPDFERSGASRSVSLAEPIRIREFGPRRYSLLRGTPADCVIVACESLLRDGPPDLVLSGVNRGQNLAEDVTYSGTIAAAMEGCSRGIRSIAMSQVFAPPREVRWDTAQAHGAGVVRALLAVQAPADVFHNVNFPDVAPDAVHGLRAVPQGRWDRVKLDVHERIDARNFPYAWLSFVHEAGNPDPDTDIGAAYGGWISVTPLHCDLTHRTALTALRQCWNEPTA